MLTRTRARLTDTLNSVAHDAKPEDDFVLILIGHGTYDGVQYKFNLVGPDISAEDLAALCDHIPSKRQLIVNTTSSSGGSIPALQKARTRRDHRNEIRHRKERDSIRALLGGSAAGSDHRHRQK